MTKVQRHFRLDQPFDEAVAQKIADAQALYGIEWIKVAPSRTELIVEFDATRLRANDVEAALQGCGIAAFA